MVSSISASARLKLRPKFGRNEGLVGQRVDRIANQGQEEKL